MSAPRSQTMPMQVLSLAWPVVAHMLLSTVVFITSRAILGHHSETALASMQATGPVLWSAQSIFTAFSAGTLALVGRSVGAGNRTQAASVAWMSLKLAVGAGTLVCLAGQWSLPWVLRALIEPSQGEVLLAAEAYLRPVLWALPLAFMESVAAATLQASGDTRTPMRAGVLANLVHLILAPTLLFGWGGLPAMGVAGAGLGAAVALALEGTLLAWALLRTDAALPLRAAMGLSAVKGQWSQLWHVSWPAVAEKLTYHVGFVIYVAMVGRLGQSVMAANQAMLGLESVCFLSADGLGIAAASLVARHLGRGAAHDAAAAAHWAAGMAAGALALVGMGYALGAPWLLSAMSSNAPVVEMATPVMLLLPLQEPLMGVAIVMTMALRGAGDTRTVLLITLCGSVGVRLGVTWLLTHVYPWGLWGVWLGAAADWAVRMVLAVALFWRGGWRTRAL